VLQASSCCGLINCRSGHAQIGSTALDVAMPGRRSSVSRDARSSGQRVDADRRGPAGSAFGRHPRAYTVCTVSTVSNREPRQSRWRYFTPRRGLGISRIPADGPDAGSAASRALERSLANLHAQSRAHDRPGWRRLGEGGKRFPKPFHPSQTRWPQGSMSDARVRISEIPKRPPHGPASESSVTRLRKLGVSSWRQTSAPVIRLARSEE